MALPDVFVPSSGDLIVRDNISAGLGAAAASDRARGERPATMGGHRFGQLSHNSFFTRHNPQPRRVFHMKGLLDAPICTVNDNGVATLSAYSLTFPPNGHNDTVLRRLPVEAINVNSSLHPINTITGLQYSTALKSYTPTEERAKPAGAETLDPESWSSFLKSISDAFGIQTQNDAAKPGEEPKRPLYSAQTGRLIPPPSRATSRGFSRRRSRLVQLENYQSPQSFLDLNGLTEESEIELTVLRMLCQILQTEDVSSVKTWLASAGEAEKSIVINLLRTAMAAKKEYYSRKSSADQQLGGDDADRQRPAADLHDSGTQTVEGDTIGGQPQNRLNTVTGEETTGRDRLQSGGGRISATRPSRAKDASAIPEEATSYELLDLKREISDASRRRLDVSSMPKNDVFQSKAALPELQKPKTPGSRMRYSRSAAPPSAGLDGYPAAASWGRSWLQDSSTA